MSDVESLDLAEVYYSTGSRVVRRELLQYGNLYGHYAADNGGYRAIGFVSADEWIDAAQQVEEQQDALIAAGDVTVRPLLSSPRG